MSLKLPQLSAEQLESAYAGVESGESALRFAEHSQMVSTNVLHVAQIIERILPPIKVVISGLSAIYLGYKYVNKFRKKPATVLRVAGASINLFVALVTLALAMTLLFIPALVPLFTLLIVALGVGRECFNLAKTTHSHVRSRQELKRLNYDIARGPDSYSASDYEQLVDRQQQLAVKHVARQYKLAHHVVDVIVGVLCVVAVALVLTTGPAGWIALAGVALVGLLLKVGLSVAKKVRIKRARVQFTPKAQPKPAATINERESEGEQLSQKHHPHRTAEIVDELQHHPHKRENLRVDHLSVEQAKAIAHDEAKLFEENLDDQKHADSDNVQARSVPKPKPTPASHKQDAIKDAQEDIEGQEDEGESGESPKF